VDVERLGGKTLDDGPSSLLTAIEQDVVIHIIGTLPNDMRGREVRSEQVSHGIGAENAPSGTWGN